MTDSASRPRSSRTHRALAFGAAALALLGVFGMYLQPDFLVLVVDRVWSCF